MKNSKFLLTDFIGLIKADKVGISSDNIDKYYEFKYKMFDNDCNIVDFAIRLTSMPVREYVDGIESDEPLLNVDGSLNDYWNEWYINATNQGFNNQDAKFDKFRNICYELQKENKGQAHDLYETTRRFIIENPITTREELDFVFQGKKLPTKYRKEAIEYLKDCYDKVRANIELEVCHKCGYVKKHDNKDVVHRLCNPKYKTKTISRGMLIAKHTIFTSIIQPGTFEVEVYKELTKAGFKARLFPDIETEGDVEVIINAEPLYLDMKAHYRNDKLYEELTKNGFLKDKYKDRWIIVPNAYYKDQQRDVQYILNKNKSRIYNIDDLIKKLKRMEDNNEK